MTASAFYQTDKGYTRHLLAALDARVTLCGRELKAMEATRWTVTEIRPAQGVRECTRCRRRATGGGGDELPTVWRWRDRTTGEWVETPIVQLDDGHLLNAIRYLEHKASEFGRITHLSAVEQAASLWPGYRALRAEAARRWPQTLAERFEAVPGRRVIRLED